MKNAAVSTAAKTAAIVLFVCALGGALLCGVGTMYLAAADAYDVAPAFSDTALCSSMASRYLFYAEPDVIQACNPFADGSEDAALARRALDALFDPEALNLRLRVTDASSGALYYGPADVEGLEAVTSRQIRYPYVENDVASGYLYGAEAAHAYPAETFPGPTLTPRPSDAAEDAAGTDAATPRPSDAADGAAAAQVQDILRRAAKQCNKIRADRLQRRIEHFRCHFQRLRARAVKARAIVKQCLIATAPHRIQDIGYRRSDVRRLRRPGKNLPLVYGSIIIQTNHFVFSSRAQSASTARLIAAICSCANL